MAHGEISENNVRMSLVIPKELKAKLSDFAQKNGYSLNGYIVYLLTNDINIMETYENSKSNSGIETVQKRAIDMVNDFLNYNIIK